MLAYSNAVRLISKTAQTAKHAHEIGTSQAHLSSMTYSQSSCDIERAAKVDAIHDRSSCVHCGFWLHLAQ